MDAVRRILDRYAALSCPVAQIDDDADLYALGLTSRTQVSVLLAVEDAFDVEFAREYAVRGTFRSISSIVAALRASAAVAGVEIEAEAVSS